MPSTTIDLSNTTLNHADYTALGPVHRWTSPNGQSGWIVVGRPEARAALTNAALAKTPSAMAGRQASTGWKEAITAPMLSHMLAHDGPEHVRLRRTVSRLFAAGAVDRFDTTIAAAVSERITGLPPIGHQVDLAAEYSKPIPYDIITSILGISDLSLVESSRLLSDVLLTPPRQLQRAGVRMARKLLSELLIRHVIRRDDLMGILARDPDLTWQEALSTAALILIAGHETTSGLITAVFYELLRDDRKALQSYRTGDLTMSEVTRRALTCHPPLPIATMRVASSPLTIADTDIAAGDLVLVSLRAPEPSTSCPHSAAAASHMSFGYGPHYCVGSHLALKQTAAAVEELLLARPDIRLDGPPVWRKGVMFGGIEQLPVQL
ncbi:cytochrome P450 [Rhodococcus sp. BS-15]|uniref:cytochrome P450 n=1 Tax=Rhodococcus sp. BS-15 TaxID=1304954 RepID=UPI000B01FF2F|nr:cytochrome P450 [Rhodococcus sp. BS-15]